MARPSRGTAPRASAPPPAAIAAGRRHTRRRGETPPRRVTDRPQATAAEGATPAQGASRASAAPRRKGPERSRAQEPAHAAASRARKRIHAVQSNAPTHLAGREHRTPTQQGASGGSRPPGTIVGDNDDRGDRAPPQRARGHRGGHAARDRGIARGTIHRPVFDNRPNPYKPHRQRPQARKLAFP